MLMRDLGLVVTMFVYLTHYDNLAIFVEDKSGQLKHLYFYQNINKKFNNYFITHNYYLKIYAFSAVVQRVPYGSDRVNSLHDK